ncbi:MAG: EAL domain-containing protein, partial [Actinomycetota bacterium]
MTTIIAVMEPAVRINHLLLVTALIGAAATVFKIRGFFAYFAAAIVSLIVTLALGGVDRPGPLVVAVVICGLVVGALTLRSRLTLEAATAELEQTVDAFGGAFFTGHVDDPVVRFRAGVESLLGWSPDDEERFDLRVLVHPDDFRGYWLPTDELRVGARFERIARFRTSSGRFIWTREVTRVVERDGRLELRGLVVDHSAHQDGLMKAKMEASTDSLTGLANRRVLLKVLDRETVDGRCLVLLDLDSFKRVNDTLGHDAGDELLRVVARRVSARLRSTDLLVRLGGDEFAVLLHGSAGDDPPVSMVERILASIAEPIALNGVVVNASASAGVVRESESTSGSRSILRRADLAMYEAKRRGAGWALFAEEMESDHGRKALIARDLSGALARGELRLHYQPILHVSGQRVLAAEGLARWEHPTLGLLGPEHFLDVVLVSAQAGLFSRVMVDDAMRTVAALPRPHRHLQVAVNLPASVVADGEFGDWFFEHCRRLDVAPARFVFEISERELHGELGIQDAILRLSERGVTVSVDDFGTGHASFDRLRWRGVTQLKLESSLVQGAVVDRRDATILRSVAALGRQLGYSIVGEGVETEEQRNRLEAVGVDAVQGWLFAPALVSEEFVEYCESFGAVRPGLAGSVGSTLVDAASPLRRN